MPLLVQPAKCTSLNCTFYNSQCSPQLPCSIKCIEIKGVCLSSFIMKSVFKSAKSMDILHNPKLKSISKHNVQRSVLLYVPFTSKYIQYYHDSVTYFIPLSPHPMSIALFENSQQCVRTSIQVFQLVNTHS